MRFTFFVGLACIASIAFATPSLACEASDFEDGVYKNLDHIISQRQLGDLAIGVFPGQDGKPTRYFHIPRSGCLHLERRFFKEIPTASFWINNNGDWGEDAPSGTFVLVTSSSTVAIEQADPISFMRNSNEGRKTIWSRAGFADEKEPVKAYRSQTMPPGVVQKYFHATSDVEFEKILPKYLAYIGTTNSPVDREYANSLWTYVGNGRPKDYDKFSITGRFPKLSLMAIAFDARDDDGGSTAQTPRISLNISGPCTFINIDSPLEQFRKKLVVQVSEGGVDCPGMK